MKTKIIDNKSNWIPHLKYVRSKVQSVGGKFMGIARRRWGKSREILKIIYEKAILLTILYGVEVWGSRANDSRIKRQLATIERPYLKAITGAYATAPTAAMAVLAGCVPLSVRAEVLYEAHNR